MVMITTSPSKPPTPMRLGADEVLLSTDPAPMATHAGSFDFLLDTVAGQTRHQRLPGAAQARCHAGAGRALPSEPLPVGVFNLIFARRNPRRLAGRWYSRNPGNAGFLR